MFARPIGSVWLPSLRCNWSHICAHEHERSRRRISAPGVWTEHRNGLNERFDSRPNVQETASYRLNQPDHGHRRLLRPRHHRPRSRSTTEQRDEFAPSHSITSSARASIAGGILTPSDFAALRLIVSSNLVGCSTGKSAAFAPLNILSM